MTGRGGRGAAAEASEGGPREFHNILCPFCFDEMKGFKMIDVGATG